MITGELKNKIDNLWDIFASGGLVNPLEVIEQITYLMFIRLLFRLREEIRSWQMYLIAWDIWSERVVDLERLSVDMNFRLIIMKRKDRLFGQTDISLRW